MEELEGLLQDTGPFGWGLGKSKTVWEETTEGTLPTDLVSTTDMVA